jgi:peptidoglycan/LPS O-acetylase OafA/YrhL
MRVGSEPTGYVTEFGGLRGILALWVFAFHTVTIAEVWDRLTPEVATLLDGGQAVRVFIILSGFVITNLLMQGRENYGVFIARRFLRLWPVFIVCIAAALAVQTIGLMPVSGEPLLVHFLVHATMLHSAVPQWLLPNSSTSILIPAWSISLEWQFYLVVPLLLMPSLPPATRLILISVSAFIFHRVLAPKLTGFGWSFLPVNAHLFWIGIISAIAYRTLLNRLTRSNNWPALVSLSVFFAVAIFLPPSQNFALLIWLLMFAISLQLRFAEPRGLAAAARAMLNARPIQWLGAVSYPFYLCHEVCIWPVQTMLSALGVSGFPLALGNFVLAGPLVLLSSALLHHGIERPAIRFGKQLSVNASARASRSQRRHGVEMVSQTSAQSHFVSPSITCVGNEAHQDNDHHRDDHGQRMVGSRA